MSLNSHPLLASKLFIAFMYLLRFLSIMEVIFVQGVKDQAIIPPHSPQHPCHRDTQFF